MPQSFRQVCFLFLLLLSPLILSSSATQYVQPNRVHELTQLSVDKYLKGAHDKPLLLQFYAPWCSHCRQFEPYYRQVAETLEGHATVARVDGASERALGIRFRIKAFPSFFLIRTGKVFKYVGTRNVSGLVNFVQSGGDRGGKLLNNFGGPLNPYWNLVTSVFWVVDFLQTRVAQYQAQGGNLVLLALGLIMAVLSAFILIIYLITLPDKHVSTPTASHAHAE